MAESAGSSLLSIRDSFSKNTVSGSSFKGSDTVNKRDFVEQSKKFVETQQKDQQSLSTIQQQINSLQTQITTLANGLTQLRSLIQKDTTSEQTLLTQEQEAEKKYAQRQIRIGKENELEKKIESALVAPVQQAAAKVENIFGKIKDALTGLFLGWLGVQGVKALKAYADKDYDALTDIKNNVIKNIGLAIGAVAAIKLGLGLVTRAIGAVVAKIGSIIFNVIRAPFAALGAGATKLGSALINRGSGTKPPGGSGGAPAAPAPKPNLIQRATGAASRALRSMGGPLLQGAVGTGLDIAMGEDPKRAAAGATGGVTAAAVGSRVGGIFGAPGRFLGGLLGYGFGSGFGKDVYNQVTGQSPPAAAPTQTSKPSEPRSPIIPTTSTPNGVTNPPVTIVGNLEENVPDREQPKPTEEKKDNVAPQTTMMPTAGDLTLNVNTDKSAKEQEYWKSEENYWNAIAKGLEEGLSYEELGLEQNEIDYLEGKTDKPPFLMQEKTAEMEGVPTELKTEMIGTKPTPPPSIPPLEQPAPNVMVAAAPAPQQQKTAIPSSTGTDVPFIPSANPDNFYVLYSKLNYNVVV